MCFRRGEHILGQRCEIWTMGNLLITGNGHIPSEHFKNAFSAILLCIYQYNNLSQPKKLGNNEKSTPWGLLLQYSTALVIVALSHGILAAEKTLVFTAVSRQGMLMITSRYRPLRLPNHLMII